MIKKRSVLFIGSFLKKSKTGGVGGQMYACNSLTNSHLNDYVNWIRLDTTAESNLRISFLKRAFNSFLRFVSFFYLIAVKKIDIILIFSSGGYSFLEKGYMAIIGKLSKKKIIFAPRSGWLLNDLNSKRRNFICKVFEKSDYIICQGENWKETFKSNFSHIPNKKFIVIKNWIDIASYPTSRTNNTRKINVLFLAWVKKEKGIFDLISVAERLYREFPNLIFNIAGSGSDIEQARSYVTQLGLNDFFVFHGWVLEANKYKLLQESDIFVLPSYFEGMPNALIEAMACGLPSIAYSVGGINDIITDAYNGFIVPVADLDRLTETLKTLIKSPELRKQIGLKARDEIIRNHNLETAVRQFERIFTN
jgi:glycosyltransferase involved in cell wall biosynthesis